MLPQFQPGGGSKRRSRRRDDFLGIDPRLGRRELPSAIERCRLCEFLVTRRTCPYVLSDRPRFATLAVFCWSLKSREDERETAIRNAGSLDQVARLSLFAEFALSIDYGCAPGGLRLCPGRSLQPVRIASLIRGWSARRTSNSERRRTSHTCGRPTTTSSGQCWALERYAGTKSLTRRETVGTAR